MKTIVKKYDVSRCVLIVPASPHPFRSSQNRPSLLFSDFYILVRTIWCHSKLFYTTTIFSIISYFLTLLAALPFLPIVAKISGWTRPDRQPCLSFSCYAPEHIYIWLYSDYSSNSCTILVLSPYYSPDKKGKRLPFSCYASIYSPARWALDAPTLTDHNQCYTTRNHKYFADKWLDID